LSQTQTQFKQKSISEVERFLEIQFNDSKIDNAMLLISTIAHKFYNTIVAPLSSGEVLTVYFYHDESSAEAEVILKDGVVLKAWIRMPTGRKTVDIHFSIDSIHRCDCYCGE